MGQAGKSEFRRNLVLIAVLLILVVGGLVLRAEREARPPGPMPTLAEDPLWGSRSIAERTARVRPIVENVTGVRLRNIPEVEAISGDRWFASWSRAAGDPGSPEEGAAHLRALMQSKLCLGICDRESDRIVVFPEKIYEVLPHQDAEGALDLVIAHELAHLVREALGAERESAAGGPEHQFVDAVLEEGFAEFVTALAAEKLGRESVFDRLRPQRSNDAPMAGESSSMSDAVVFGRLAGRRFFGEVAARHGVIDTVRLVFEERPPRTVLQIVRPAEYLGDTPFDSELHALGRELLQSLAGGKGKVTSVWSTAGLPPARPDPTWLGGADVLGGVRVFDMEGGPLAGRRVGITVFEDDGREPPSGDELVTPGLFWPLRRRILSFTEAGPLWISRLDDPDAPVPPLVVGTRADGFRVLVESNANEHEVPFLRALARHVGAVVRGEDAAFSIAEVLSGPPREYPTEVGEILSLLDDEDPSARFYAVQAVGAADDLDFERKRELLAGLTEDPVPAVRRAAWASLIKTIAEGPLPLALLTRGAEHEDRYVRRQVVLMLRLRSMLMRRTEDRARLGPLCVALLGDEDVGVRLMAIGLAGDLKGAMPSAVPALVRMLGDDALRAPALEALAGIGPPAAPALDELGRMLREGICTTAVCEAVGKIAVPGSPFTGELVPLLSHGNPFTRYSALVSLLRLEVEVPDKGRGLAEILGRGTRQQMRDALQLLEEMPDQTVGEVGRQLDGMDDRTRLKVTGLLWDRELHAPSVEDGLWKALRSTDSLTRMFALDEFWRFPDGGREAQRFLRTALEDPDDGVRREAVRKLDEVERPEPETVALALDRIDDEDERIVEGVFEYLHSLPPAARPAPLPISRLEAHLEDPRLEVRGAAAALLWRQGVRGENIRRVLEEAGPVPGSIGEAARAALGTIDGAGDD